MDGPSDLHPLFSFLHILHIVINVLVFKLVRLIVLKVYCSLHSKQIAMLFVFPYFV